MRRFRSAIGDPVAVISTHDDAEVRVGLRSLFDDAIVDGFRWPLHPLDDIERITGSITELLEECRVNDIHIAGKVMPALNAQKQTGFPTVRDLDHSLPDS